MVENYKVQVEKNGEVILAIETGFIVSGPDLTEENEGVINGCAQNLLSFIGRTPKESGTHCTSPNTASDAIALIKESLTVVIDFIDEQQHT